MKCSALSFVNDTFVASEEAKLTINDRGFRFGDGLFETIAVHDGVPYQWEFHLSRLQNGLDAYHIPYSAQHLASNCKTLLHHNNCRHGFLRIAISRGTGSQGYAPEENITPTLVIQCLPTILPTPSCLRLHVASLRKIPPQCLPTGIKSAQAMNSILALMEAKQHGADDALQLSLCGNVSETSSGNVFWLKQGMVWTPSPKTDCVLGSTRHAVLRLCKVQQTEAPLEEIMQADAVAISNVRYGIIACNLHKHQGPHEIWHHVQALLLQDRAQYAAIHQSAWQ